MRLGMCHRTSEAGHWTNAPSGDARAKSSSREATRGRSRSVVRGLAAQGLVETPVPQPLEIDGNPMEALGT